MVKERPVWDRETMSVRDYQQALVAFLHADLPRHAFAPSLYLVALLERIADTEQQLADMSSQVREQQAALQAVKLRMHFIGWSAEKVWSPNDDGRTIPDWRAEIALVEHALTGCVLPGLPTKAGKQQ